MGGWIALIAVPTVIVLMMVSSANLFATSASQSSAPAAAGVTAPGASHPIATAPSIAAAPSGDPVTHGDLIVPRGVTITIAPLSGTQTYYQGGNITVEAGGTLIVQDTTISFVQYIVEGGTLGAELSHIYRFTDAGTVRMYNSGITTNTAILNAVPKLFLGITGNFTAWNSSFEFPGWIVVHGSSADATFNGSAIAANPDIDLLTEPQVMYADSIYAPTLNVTGGATFNWFGGTYQDPYVNNYTLNGMPTSQSIQTTQYVWLNSSAERDVPNSAFSIPGATAVQLAEDMLYPAQGTEFALGASYDNTGTKAVNATVALNYDGMTLPWGNLTFTVGTGLAQLFTYSPSAILSAMYLSGAPFYTSMGVNFTSFSVTNANLKVNVTELTLSITPALNYAIAVSDSATVINLVNVALPLTWNVPDPTMPWNSTKLELTDGATGNFVGLTTPNNDIATFGYTSAIAVDAVSTANLYRWAQLEFLGGPAPPTIGVYNVSILAAYSYDTNQSNNATANGLISALTTKGNPIYGYAQYLAGASEQLGYGVSGPFGIIPVILPSGQLTSASEPNGVYLGTYHIAAHVPFLKGIQSFYGSVSPYPQGVAANTPDFGTTDDWPSTFYSQYVVTPSVGPISVTANGTLSTDNSARIGQVLGLNVTFTNKGDAPVYSLVGLLAWNNTTDVKAPTGLMTFLNASVAENLSLWGGESYVAHFTWFINDSNRSLPVDQGAPFLHDFFGKLYWYASPIGVYYGNKAFYYNVTIEQSQIRIVSASAAPTPIDLSAAYITTGVIQYNGSRSAALTLNAVSSSGVLVPLGTSSSLPGTFSIDWITPLSSVLSAGTTYTVEIVAEYNGVSTTYIVGSISVPSTPSPVSNFLLEKILGLPLWIWLAIAAAIVVAVVAFLLFARRQAAGKLVECGECGNLIPEDATVCPKCGAEFEHDLIRCSRCASTIPADSKVCPECAAQLLGKPGEAEADPERQGYADFTERYRAEAKRELGVNFSEGAFWDWWKRQPSYTSFSQWKLQQGTGTPRAGMTAPPAATEAEEAKPPVSGPPPGAVGGAAAIGVPPSPPPAATPVAPAAVPTGPAAGAPPGGPLKPCPSCGKEIPPEYLVCPFCGAVTQ